MTQRIVGQCNHPGMLAALLVLTACRIVAGEPRAERFLARNPRRLNATSVAETGDGASEVTKGVAVFGEGVGVASEDVVVAGGRRRRRRVGGGHQHRDFCWQKPGGTYCNGFKKLVKCHNHRQVHTETCYNHQQCRQHDRARASCGIGNHHGGGHGTCSTKEHYGSFCEGDRALVTCRNRRLVHRKTCHYGQHCRQHGWNRASCGGEHQRDICWDKFFSGTFCDGRGTLVTCRDRRLVHRRTCHHECREHAWKRASCVEDHHGGGGGICWSKGRHGSFCDGDRTVVSCAGRRQVHRYQCGHWQRCCQYGNEARCE